jgi:hypothetical protein
VNERLTIVDPPGPFTTWERAALDRLLELDHPWSEGLRVQLADAAVAGRCHHCPTIDITVPGGTPKLALPAEPSSIDMPALHGRDADGMFVEIMLIVIDSEVTAMDVWRGDGGTFTEPPLETFGPANFSKG